MKRDKELQAISKMYKDLSQGKPVNQIATTNTDRTIPLSQTAVNKGSFAG